MDSSNSMTCVAVAPSANFLTLLSHYTKIFTFTNTFHYQYNYLLFFSGHLDVIVAYHPSVNTYRSLSFSGSAEFAKTKRNPWYHNKKLVGYENKCIKIVTINTPIAEYCLVTNLV